MSKALEYLKKINSKTYNNPTGGFTAFGIRFYIKEPVQKAVNVKDCIEFIFSRIPKRLYNNINSIQIGKFPFLNSRHLQAMYKDGTIYVTNEHEDNNSLISDIIHEISHAFEEAKHQEIYGDELVKNEFIEKRRTLYRLLSTNSLVGNKISENDFLKTEYCIKFDEYLYSTLGYERLWPYTNGLFISPYAATSLGEYFANAFENFFVNDIFIVKKTCPQVYNKLVLFLEM
jgi:hypothetical protein